MKPTQPIEWNLPTAKTAREESMACRKGIIKAALNPVKEKINVAIGHGLTECSVRPSEWSDVLSPILKSYGYTVTEIKDERTHDTEEIKISW